MSGSGGLGGKTGGKKEGSKEGEEAIAILDTGVANIYLGGRRGRKKGKK